MASRPGATTLVSSVALALVNLIGPGLVAAQAPAATPPAPSSVSQNQPHQLSDRVRRQIDELRVKPEGNRLPPADSFTVGPRQIPASATVRGPIAVAEGSLDVYGHVDGDVFVLDGDVVLHGGAVITGDALSIGGRVTLDGGRVDGEVRTLSPSTGAATRAAAERAPLSTWQSVKLVIGWFALLVIIGLGVMIFAEPNINGVVAALERSFARAFWFGVLGEIMALPALLLLCIGLVLTLLGVLLVPFAIVAYCIAVAGLLALGFLAVALLTGSVWSRTQPTTPASARAANLRALFIGLVLYMGLWMLAALFAWQPIAGAVLRGIALAVSWVAVTVGLGAALLSRAGTRHLEPRAGGAAPRRPAPDDLAWQTPTPVTGVTAARRPPTAAAKDSV
jgi:hypothetical protein